MSRLRALLRLWFTFESPVDRRTYLVHGAGLMALKYAVDAAVVWAGSGTLWTPLDYLQPLMFFERTHLTDAAPFVAPVLALWTLPFLWIGVTMTIRRLLDVGRSAWWSLFFFVPPISYALMLVLASVPGEGGPAGRGGRGGREEAGAPEDLGAEGAASSAGSAGAAGASADAPGPAARRLPSALLSIGVGAALGLAMMAVAVLLLDSYGLALFMGTPFAVGLVTAYLLSRRYPATRTETTEVVAMTVLFMGGAAFVIGFEGAICLLMVAPLGIVLALMGGLVGRFLARAGERPMQGAAMIALLLPGSAIAEAGGGEASLREVRSAVVIDASAEEVWEEVIAFSPIPEPTSLLFRLGLAYPTHARIEGEGVGAVRYCVFSTGAFVEPITAWEPGRRLSFDVVESPPPLRELSFHSVAPPHLEGYLAPRRGEFRLVPLADGRTRLEGSTWYEQRLRPGGYWAVFSDWIIGKIHGRVLGHVRGSVEGGRDPRGAGDVEDAASLGGDRDGFSGSRSLDLVFEPLVDLRTGTDSLTLDDRRARPTVTGGLDRGWFVGGLMLGYKWAEFGPDGTLVRAPGRRGEGPGEFQRIDYVFPVAGDTVVVAEGSRITRALRDGTYVDRQRLGFRPESYARHDGLLWLSGSSPRGLFLAALDRSGKLQWRFQLPGTGRASYSGHVATWQGGLWLWEYPRGPLHEIDPTTGAPVESWSPFPDAGDGSWRATPSAGPDGTLIFDYFDPDGETGEREWIVFGPDRHVVHREIQEPDMQGGHFFQDKAWGPILEDDPVPLFVGLRVFELGLVGEGVER